jgi:hypothetical protein
MGLAPKKELRQPVESHYLSGFRRVGEHRPEKIAENQRHQSQFLKFDS